MELKAETRQSLFVAIIVLYLIPFLFFVFYSIGLMSKEKSWMILSLGLLIVACGTFALFVFIYYWEQSFKHQLQYDSELSIKQYSQDKETKVTALSTSVQLIDSPKVELSKEIPPINKESSKELNFLEATLQESQQLRVNEDLKKIRQEIETLEEEKRISIQQLEETLRDFSDYKLFSEEQLKHKSSQLSELQQLVENQQIQIAKKQENIQQLESKVRDLSYEIKTLLYLQEPKFNSTELKRGSLSTDSLSSLSSIKEKPIKPFEETEIIKTEVPENYVKNASEASNLLKHCINTAQKLSGSNYYGNEASRYWELSTPRYAIDQRRLFDSLRNEENGLIFVYSLRDNRMLFVNNQSKILLGWSSEKFVQDFAFIIQEGLADWKKSISNLNGSPEIQTRLLMKSKQGQEIMMHCHLGNIPAGVFKNHVIGVLYPA